MNKNVMHETFTNEEDVLSFLLSFGYKTQKNIGLSRSLLRKHGSLRETLKFFEEENGNAINLNEKQRIFLSKINDITRFLLLSKAKEEDTANSTKNTAEYLYFSMRDLRFELFKLLIFNVNNRLIKVIDLFRGSISSATIYPRDVVDAVLREGGAAVIIAHNHPSGENTPSKEDIEVTEAIYNALASVNVRLNDHLIVGKKGLYSFLKEGLFDEMNDSSFAIAEKIKSERE